MGSGEGWWPVALVVLATLGGCVGDEPPHDVGAAPAGAASNDAHALGALAGTEEIAEWTFRFAGPEAPAQATRVAGSLEFEQRWPVLCGSPPLPCLDDTMSPRTVADVALSERAPAGVPTVVEAQLTISGELLGRSVDLDILAPASRIFDLQRTESIREQGSALSSHFLLVRPPGETVRVAVVTGRSQEPAQGMASPMDPLEYELVVTTEPLLDTVPRGLPVAVDVRPGDELLLRPRTDGSASATVWEESGIPLATLAADAGAPASFAAPADGPRTLILYLNGPAQGATLEGHGTANASRTLRALAVETWETPLVLLTDSAAPTPGPAEARWSFMVDAPVLQVALFALLSGSGSEVGDVSGTIKGPDGAELARFEEGRSGSVIVGARRLQDARWATEPADLRALPGAYEAWFASGSAYRASVGAAITQIVVDPTERSNTMSIPDSWDDVALPMTGAQERSDAGARSNYDVTFVSTRDAGNATVELTLGLRNLSAVNVPPGYRAVAYAIAIDTDLGAFLAAYVQQTDGTRLMLCSSDTLVLTPLKADPVQGSYEVIQGSVRSASGEGDALVRFVVPAHLCLGESASGPMRVHRVGGGTYLLPEISPGSAEAQLVRVHVMDDAEALVSTTIFEKGLRATPGTVLSSRPLTDDEALAAVSVPFQSPSRAWWPFVAGGALLLALLALAAVLVARRRRDASPEPGTPLSAGQLFLGKYRIKKTLGKGGFGVVWLAEHVALSRPVVIKQLHPQLMNMTDMRKRFEREARILARLDHPNVTRIHDVERVAGTWYIVMEHVAGGSLEDRIARGPLAARDAVRIVRQTLAGLDHIHRRGVLHRDIKPSNLLLTASGQVKLADFGVSRSVDFKTTLLTPTGSPPGTPLYMAPEHMQGEPGDQRSDLYAVAAVAYRALTGRWHLGAEPSSMGKLVAAFDRHKVVLPAPGVQEALADWLRRGLERAPEDRFQSAAEMVAALDVAWLGAQVVDRFVAARTASL